MPHAGRVFFFFVFTFCLDFFVDCYSPLYFAAYSFPIVLYLHGYQALSEYYDLDYWKSECLHTTGRGHLGDRNRPGELGLKLRRLDWRNSLLSLLNFPFSQSLQDINKNESQKKVQGPGWSPQFFRSLPLDFLKDLTWSLIMGWVFFFL